MDRMVEEAFRLNVKWSLQELSRAINGDGKSAPNPLLRVKVVLEGDKVSSIQVLHSKRLMEMCRWIGSHFRDWNDYNGVAFTMELLEWGRTFWGILGVRKFWQVGI